jgi:hypothetical protein
LGAGKHCFALFKTRLAKVRVQVDEARQRDQTAAVNSFFAGETWADCNDFVAFDLNVGCSPVSEIHIL